MFVNTRKTPVFPVLVSILPHRTRVNRNPYPCLLPRKLTNPFSLSIWASQALGLVVTCSSWLVCFSSPRFSVGTPTSLWSKSSFMNWPSIKNFHFPLNMGFKIFFLNIQMMYQLPRKSFLSPIIQGSYDSALLNL